MKVKAIHIYRYQRGLTCPKKIVSSNYRGVQHSARFCLLVPQTVPHASVGKGVSMDITKNVFSGIIRIREIYMILVRMDARVWYTLILRVIHIFRVMDIFKYTESCVLIPNPPVWTSLHFCDTKLSAFYIV